MKLSELITQMQATLDTNGDTEVGICLVMGRTTKYRLDAFGDVDVMHSDGEYINGMTYLIAEYDEHWHEPPNAELRG